MEHARPASQPGRVAALDGLRGVAAVAVLLNHALLALPELDRLSHGSNVSGVSVVARIVAFTPVHLAWAGTEAVLVFFVLSGFVLTTPALRRKPDWASYYPSRLLRLYVPAVAALLIAAVWCLLFPRVHGTDFVVSRHETVTAGAVLHDAVLVAGSTNIDHPLWSLQWEVLFSLLLPVYLLVARRTRRYSWVVAGVTLTVIVAGRVLHIDAVQYLPVFLFGALMAVNLDRLTVLATKLDRRPWAWWTLTVAAALLICSSWYALAAHMPTAAGYVFIVVGAVTLTFSAIFWAPFSALLTTRLVGWLGTVSFSLYLTHEPLIVSIATVLPPGAAWLVPIVGVPASLAFAWLFYVAVERPGHRLSQTVRSSIRARPSAKLLPTRG